MGSRYRDKQKSKAEMLVNQVRMIAWIDSNQTPEARAIAQKYALELKVAFEAWLTKHQA